MINASPEAINQAFQTPEPLASLHPPQEMKAEIFAFDRALDYQMGMASTLNNFAAFTE